MRSHLITGAQVSLYVNGKIFAQVTNFAYTINTPRKHIYCVDSSEPFELATTTHACSGTMALLRQSGDGAAEGAQLVAPLWLLTKEKYVSITLLETHTDLIIFEATKCSVTSQSWSAGVRGLVTGNIAFDAISYSNEVRPAVQ